jgi:hypothetical protein
MPLTFPAHQGLILPIVRRWPDRFDALALSVGAAMPDVIDSILGFSINGYFEHWYGHALISAFAIDIPVGLFLIWLVTVLSARFVKDTALIKRKKIVAGWQSKPDLWVFSMVVGIISHLGFDLISHEKNLLLYPWYENVRWFPEWWYAKWFEVRIPLIFSHPYSVGFYSFVWGILTLIGILLFYRFVTSK